MSDQPSTRPDGLRTAVGIVIVTSALVAAAAPGQPTGVAVFDVVERAALGSLVAWAAAWSRPWTRWLCAGAAVVLAGSSAWLAVAVLALALTALRALRPDGNRAGTGVRALIGSPAVTGALVGGLSIQVLLRAAPVGRFGFTAAVTGVVAAALVVSAHRAAGPGTRRRIRLVGGAVAVFVVVATAGFVISAWQASIHVERGLDYAELGVEQAGLGAQKPATLALWVAREDFRRAHDRFDAPWMQLAAPVPVLSQHARLARTATGAAHRVAADALATARVATYDELRDPQGTFDLAGLEAMRAPMTTTIATSRHTLERLDEVTSPWLVAPLQARLESFRADLIASIPRAEDALEALAVAPVILGGDEPRHYLILFANPAESRGLGGFIAGWAELSVAEGRVEMVRHGHIAEFNDATDWRTRHISGPAEYLDRYSGLQPQRYVQNVSASPDFPTVARVTEELYAQAMGTRLDGVLYVDPIALGALLELTGPVYPEGVFYRLHADNAADFLMHEQYLTFRGDKDGRIDLLAASAEATFQALIDRKLPPLGTITETLGPMVDQGRLLFSSNEPRIESYLTRIGMTGAFPAPDGGDLLSVRISNAATNKADYYLDQHTDYQVRLDPATGTVEATARITFTNHAPDHGEPPYVLGNPDSRRGLPGGRPFGSDTVAVSVYSALRPGAADVEGLPLRLQVQRELGLWVGTQVLTIPPGDEVTFEVDLQGQVDLATGYRLTVVPQPSARPRSTTVTVHPDGTSVSAGGAAEGSAISRTFDRDRVEQLRVPVGVPDRP